MCEVKEDRTKEFYANVIKLFSNEVIQKYFGEESDFIKYIQDYQEKEEDIEVEFKNGLKIRFTQVTFSFIFCQNTNINFNEPVGKRFVNDGYIYLELVEANTVNIINPICKMQLLPIKEEENTIGYFYINNPENNEEIDYPEEILPFFIFQLKSRLRVDYFNLFTPTSTALNFFLLFKPIRHILKIKDSNDFLEKGLYETVINYGLIELSLQENKILEIEPNNTVSELKLKVGGDAKAIPIYISAFKNEAPFYQFLDLYHIIESYFYDFFAEYFKDNISNAHKLVKEMRDSKLGDEYLVKKSFIQLTKETNMIDFIKDELDKIRDRLEGLIQELNQNLSGGELLKNYDKWDNDGKYSEYLARFIYKLRSEVAHRKIREKTLEEYAFKYLDVIKVINKIMFKIGENIINKR